MYFPKLIIIFRYSILKDQFSWTSWWFRVSGYIESLLIHLLLQLTSNEVSTNRFLFAWLVKKPTWRNPRHFLETKSKRSTIIIRFALKLRWVFFNKIERESIKVNCWLFHLSFFRGKNAETFFKMRKIGRIVNSTNSWLLFINTQKDVS